MDQNHPAFSCHNGYCHWFEANKTCKNRGARLVEIDSAKENDQIVREIKRRGYKERHFWIGSTDLKQEGIWRLESTGQKPGYTNWTGDPIMLAVVRIAHI